MQVAEV